MPVIGRAGLPLFDRRSRCLSAKEEETTNTGNNGVNFNQPLVANTTHNHFRHYRVRFMEKLADV